MKYNKSSGHNDVDYTMPNPSCGISCRSVSDPPAIQVEAMDADGSSIVGPIVPSAPEGGLPRPAGVRPSAPVFKDVGCQTPNAMCSSMATQTSVVHQLWWIATAETQTPAPPECCDASTSLQHDLASCADSPLRGLKAS